MGTRRKSRELALQMLFQSDMGKQAADEVRTTFWRGRGEVDAEVHGFAEDLFRAACDRAPDIDQLIEQHAEHWRMDRMAAVDRNILRAAVAEMIGFPQTPAPLPAVYFCRLPPCGPCASARRSEEHTSELQSQ